MAVRRLNPDQPPSFAFTAENQSWAETVIRHYPEGKQAAAIIPLLWRAQEQNDGWLSEPAMRTVAAMLGMADIRAYEIATFYTMFQLSPVGRKAHVQVCGTTPCMLRGSNDLIALCKARISHDPHTLSDDGNFSWEEVECLGSCANAPMAEIGKDTYEDLTPDLLGKVLDGFASGKILPPGSQIGRKVSCPEGGPTTLTDQSLYDGSTIGAWKKRFAETTPSPAPSATETSPASALASPARKAAVSSGQSPSQPLAQPLAQTPAQVPASPPVNPAVAALVANSGLVAGLEARGEAKALSASEIEHLKRTVVPGPVAATSVGAAGIKPELLTSPRDGKADDLKLIWGVAETLEKRLNDIGIWHFNQIASWSPENITWFESQLNGFNGRIARDNWVEQCAKLATGWRPASDVGERPKG